MDALGKHLLVEYYDCDSGILDDVVAVETLMLKAAQAADATIINASFHHFSPYGVSGVIVIQESHLSIHTWPEAGYAAVDLFTCGPDTRPWEAFKVLNTGLEAKKQSAIEIQRGSLASSSRLLSDQSNSSAPESIRFRRNVWFTERNEVLALSLKLKGKRLFDETSPYQRVEVYDSLAYGRMLTLDGKVVLTEKDEYIYHEMMVHIAMQSHPSPKRVLVIGGGDGGNVREVLRYPEVEQIDIVEIDETVVRAALLHFPELAASLEAARCNLLIMDVQKFIQKQQDYDIILVDSPQLIEAEDSAGSIYAQLAALLKSDGLMMLHNQSPRFQPVAFQEGFSNCKNIFGAQCWPILVYIPTYPSGSWSFVLGRNGSGGPFGHFLADRAAQFSTSQKLRYYNAAVHQAAFALPNDVQALIQ